MNEDDQKLFDEIGYNGFVDAEDVGDLCRIIRKQEEAFERIRQHLTSDTDMIDLDDFERLVKDTGGFK